jgi:adenylate cyclase
MWHKVLPEDPLEAVNAVAAAREMLRAVGASNVGNAWPIRLGIGIHIGHAVAGTVGSPRRKEYTVVGDTVNLASRLVASRGIPFRAGEACFALAME